MSRRSTRQTKTKATSFRTTRGRIKRSGKTYDDLQTNRRAVVEIDPFLSVNNQDTDYCSPPNVDENDIKIEQLEGNFPCLWKVGTESSCSKICESPDDLIDHLLRDHAKYGSGGYICCWKNCSKRSSTAYKTVSELKDHLKFHTVISPFSGEEEDEEENDNNFSADSNYQESEEEEEAEESTDSDYMDSSDEEYTKSKRKRKSLNKNSKSRPKQKKLGSQSPELPKPQQNNITANPVTKTSSGLKELSPIALNFYRFTCMWVVPFTLRGKNSTQKQNVVCQRKFTVLDESIEHLQGHHLARIKSENGALKCHWKGCEQTLQEFETMDELMEHVLVHSEEKMLTFSNNLMANLASNRNMTKSPVLEKPSSTHEDNTRKTMHDANSIAEIPVESSEEDFSVSKENDSWMVAVLRLLISSKVDTEDVALCPTSQLCFFCRFCSLKNRLSKKENLTSYSFYEFTLEKKKFKSFVNRPADFFDKLLDDLISHESVCHNGKVFSETFWVKCLKSDPPSCITHKLNKNLINLFPVQYKSCNGCASDCASWPTSAHYNLIIKLEPDNRVCYPDVLMVKGRVYQLSSVMCKCPSDDNSFITYVRMKCMWIAYYESSCKVVSASQVFGDKDACIAVAYKLKASVSDSSKSSSNASCYSFEDCRDTQFKICDNAVVEDFEPPIDDTSYIIKPPLMKKMGEKLVSLFRCRQLINDGEESCINSVLQAILQTGLVKIVKKLCPNTNQCYFCRMLSFIQRAICSSEEKSIRAFEFVVHKEEFGITEEEGIATKFVVDLINQIVADERANHDSSDAKYTFMIRQKKRTCSCLMSCEGYHWTVSPKRRNESLLDLMANCSMHCTQCNVLTTVQPIQMPDNLIITIERTEESKDACVHYPDEWASYNIRYFLSSIVVEDRKGSKDAVYYYTYCKVFGKWMCYDDERITKASTSDVFGNRKACVLVYVAKELTPQALQEALADAKCYSFKKNLPISIKEEPIE